MAVRKTKKTWWVIPLMAFTLLYAAFAFTSQSKDLYSINLKIKELQAKLQTEKEHRQELVEEKDEISSDENIEKIAREKLGMVKDGERVFVDTNK
jgi:cell division protein FtsL